MARPNRLVDFSSRPADLPMERAVLYYACGSEIDFRNGAERGLSDDRMANGESGHPLGAAVRVRPIADIFTENRVAAASDAPQSITGLRLHDLPRA